MNRTLIGRFRAVAATLSDDYCYYSCLAIFCLAAISFIFTFTASYFDPAYLVELRSAAPLFTVVALQDGINPYTSDALERSANIYSIIWPLILYNLGIIFDHVGIYEYRYIAFASNFTIVSITAILIIFLCIRNGFDFLAAFLIGMTVILLNTTRISMGEWSYSPGVCLGLFALILAVNGNRASHFLISLVL